MSDPTPREHGQVRVHQETGRDSRLYRLEFSDGDQVWSEPLWSVTTLIRAIDKPAIPYWAARGVATTAIQHRQYLDADVQRFGEREAIYQLSQAPWRQRSRAGEIGTAVHALIDAHVRGAELPPVPEDLRAEVEPRFEQFHRFLAEYRPTFHGAEMTVYNPEHGWAGTLDELAEIGTRGLGLIDVKCTNAGRDGEPGVYAEHGLQCAAYRHGRWIVPVRGAWAEPVPMPELAWGAVLWLATDRFALVEVDVSAETYRAFRIAAELWRWTDGPGKRAVLGEAAPATFGVMPEAPAGVVAPTDSAEGGA